MRFSRNYDGIPEQEDYQLLPEGNYMMEIFEVKEGYSKKNNDPMPNITLRCIEDGEYEGRQVWDNILIPSPDSEAHKIIGRTKRFLHAIDEPYQGDFDVDTDNWLNKTVEVKIGQEQQTEGKYKGKMKNVVKGYLLSESQQNNKNNSLNNFNKTSEEADLPF